VFDVTAIDRQTVEAVKKDLRPQLEQLVDTDEILNDVFATMGTEFERMIMDLQTSEVKILIGKWAK